MRAGANILAAMGLLLVAACQEAEPGESRGSTTPRYQRADADASLLEQARRPVRIGELGPSFAACSTHATTRSRSAADPLVVRDAPDAGAQETGRLPAAASFFICSRSLDQKWFGIVYEPGGTLADRCNVSRPVASRRDYEGPCSSGWVSSAFVKLVGR